MFARYVQAWARNDRTDNQGDTDMTTTNTDPEWYTAARRNLDTIANECEYLRDHGELGASDTIEDMLRSLREHLDDAAAAAYEAWDAGFQDGLIEGAVRYSSGE